MRLGLYGSGDAQAQSSMRQHATGHSITRQLSKEKKKNSQEILLFILLGRREHADDITFRGRESKLFSNVEKFHYVRFSHSNKKKIGIDNLSYDSL